MSKQFSIRGKVGGLARLVALALLLFPLVASAAQDRTHRAPERNVVPSAPRHVLDLLAAPFENSRQGLDEDFGPLRLGRFLLMPEAGWPSGRADCLLAPEPVEYGFQAREMDSESGLQYFRARSYDPRTGRFTSRDPLPHANLYNFVENDPVNLTDPQGLEPTPEAMEQKVELERDRDQASGAEEWNRAMQGLGDWYQNQSALVNRKKWWRRDWGEQDALDAAFNAHCDVWQAGWQGVPDTVERDEYGSPITNTEAAPQAVINARRKVQTQNLERARKIIGGGLGSGFSMAMAASGIDIVFTFEDIAFHRANMQTLIRSLPQILAVLARGSQIIFEIKGARRVAKDAEEAMRIASDLERTARDIPATKLIHIFEKAQHDLDGVVKTFGSQETAYLAIEQATQTAVNAGKITGRFNKLAVSVGGETIKVSGNVIDGIAKIGTAYK